MNTDRSILPGLTVLALLASCKSESVTPPPPPPPPPPSPLTCSSVTPVQLAVGQHQVVDPAQTGGCVRVPVAGAGGAEYAVVVVSGSGLETDLGVSGSYLLRAANPGATASAALGSEVVAPAVEPRPLSAADRFHLLLRRRERELAGDPSLRAGPPAAPAAPAAPPLVGDQKTFKVCGNLLCSSFVDVTATARFVGTHAAIFLDNTVPTNDPLQDPDFQELGNAFDNRHYPIDNTSFGPESDIDSNQRVIILMTDQVNSLTPDCTNGRILGYFFGGDLLVNSTGSNKGEVFYTFVPAPATAQCTAVSRRQVIDNVKPTLIHEFQHMISFNQHVLLRGGQGEETWLNEAMSHLAEELGGRLIPAAECAGFSSCRSQYISGDIINSYDYLTDTEASFLIYPGSSNGTLEERGASWLFLRWVVDQFATDSIIGTDFTPALEQTSVTGFSNITGNTGASFATLVAEWLLASLLDDNANFVGISPRMRFKSWGLRTIWTNPANAQIFPGGFPLKPDSTSGSYSHSGTLRGGSGRHLRLIQQPSGLAIDVQVTKNDQGAALDAALQARIGIVRVR